MCVRMNVNYVMYSKRVCYVHNVRSVRFVCMYVMFCTYSMFRMYVSMKYNGRYVCNAFLCMYVCCGCMYEYTVRVVCMDVM